MASRRISPAPSAETDKGAVKSVRRLLTEAEIEP